MRNIVLHADGTIGLSIIEKHEVFPITRREGDYPETCNVSNGMLRFYADKDKDYKEIVRNFVRNY